MKSAIQKISVSFLCLLNLVSFAQFTAPDTVCVGELVSVQLNTAIAGKNFYWGFCSGNVADPPVGVNLGNSSNTLHNPKYITLVADGADCFSFITSSGDSSITRNYHGTSFNNPPLATKSWSGLGVLTHNLKGIQIVSEGGFWYGFIVNGSALVQLNFGPNIRTGDPSVGSVFPLPGVSGTSDFKLLNNKGTWTAFGTDSTGNSIYRLLFNGGLLANPTVYLLGNNGQLDGPAGLSLIADNGNWFMFVTNENNSTISRIDFGTSLVNNNPVGINLGNPGGLLNSATGIAISVDCQHVDGIIVNHSASGNQLVQLRFEGGVNGTLTPVPLGNTGTLNMPYGISNFKRSGDTLVTMVTNSGNSTLSALHFLPCSAASRPGDTLRNPPPFFYLSPGNYNINLSYTSTGANQTSQGGCRPIVVMPPLTVSLGGNKHICDGGSTLLTPDSNYVTYFWNTGSTASYITVGNPGKYYVDVTNQWGCKASDTVMVYTGQPITITVYTTVCYGQSYYAQGAWQTVAGTYLDTLKTTAGCDSLVTTHLMIKPRVIIYLGNDTILCPGGKILLNATTLNASSYTWQDGSTDSIFQVTQPGTYWVHVTVDNCIFADTIHILSCPPQLWFPNAFTPNNDGINDVYRPVGVSISRFHMIIFDRWGTLIFETNDMSQGWNGMSKGQFNPPGTYTFIADYEVIDAPGVTRKVSGTFNLIR